MSHDQRAMRCNKQNQHLLEQMPRFNSTSAWELNLQRPVAGLSRILSLPTGQELAPWQLHQVAVASQGLSPQPLLISAAGKAAPAE